MSHHLFPHLPTVNENWGNLIFLNAPLKVTERVFYTHPSQESKGLLLECWVEQFNHKGCNIEVLCWKILANYFVYLKSNSAILYNKGHNFWKSVSAWKIPKNWAFTRSNRISLGLTKEYMAHISIRAVIW